MINIYIHIHLSYIYIYESLYTNYGYKIITKVITTNFLD